MPDLDLIRRGDAKAAIAAALNTYVISHYDRERILASLDAVPAAGVGEKQAKPPMLLVTLRKGWHPEWWIRHLNVWRQASGAETSSKYIFEVDRIASDAEALRLYDEDMNPSSPAVRGRED